jgi:hypothetical protein
MNWECFCRDADRLLFRQLASYQHTQQGGVVMSQATMTGVINGVDVDRMGTTIQAVQQNTNLATFKFRAKNRWIGGGHNCSTIQSFYGAGQEYTTRKKPFVLDSDEPSVLLGTDQGPNPYECVHALAAGLTTSLVYHAAARGIHLESVESTLEEISTYKDFWAVGQGPARLQGNPCPLCDQVECPCRRIERAD